MKCVGNLFVTMLFLTTLRTNSLLTPGKDHYYVGAWNGGTVADLIRQYKPVLEDYLNAQVGPLYNPAIIFKMVPVDFEGNATGTQMIKNGLVDFIFHSPGGTTCLEATFDFQPIVTQRQLILGKEAGVFGSLVYSLKSNGAIKTLTDLRGKRVAVGQPLASGAYQQGWNYLNQQGINIFVDTTQIIFYQSDYKRMLNDVLSGAADYAMVKSGWIEGNANDKLPLLRLHDLRKVSFQGEDYPFLTTSQLVPNSALSAHPSVPRLLRQQIFKALTGLNRTHPAAKAGGLSGFTYAYSYDLARIMAEQLGILRSLPDGSKECLDQFAGLYDLLSCPKGYYKIPKAQLNTACDDDGLPCPSGLVCFCQPCRVDNVVNPVWFWAVLAGCLVVVYFSVGS